MATYVKEILDVFEKNNIVKNTYNIAVALRVKLGNEKVKEIYNTLGEEIDFVDFVPEYNYYWAAVKMIEMENAEESDDGLRYPSHGWINGDLWYPLASVTAALNTLNGVEAHAGIIYPKGSFYRSKGYWTIDFDTIEDFNHFLWAGCHRYLPLTKSEKWRILPNLGDPDYNEKKLKFELHYMKLNAKKEDMEKDFADMAKCIEDYSNDENEIKAKLEK